MKYLFFILTLVFTLNSNASILRTLLLERVEDSQGNLVKYVATAYIKDNDGAQVIKEFKTGAQLLKLAKIANINNYAKKISKNATRIWIYFNDDGTINRIDQQATGNFEQAINIPTDVDSSTQTDVTALKTYAEGLIP